MQWQPLATVASSLPEAVTDEVKQGDELVPYVGLARLIVTKRGIAYGREPTATERRKYS